MTEETAKSKKAKKAKKAIAEKDGFNLSAWGDVKLVVDQKYWIVRSRLEKPGVTMLDTLETPAEPYEAAFWGYEVKKTFDIVDDGVPPLKDFASYAFDAGRRGRYLTIKIEDREDFIFPGTAAGKKMAETRCKEWAERHQELIKAARHKDDKVAEEMAASVVELYELGVMCLALGGTDKDLKDVGKSRKKKIEAIMRLRPIYFEKKAKGPIPDRPSSTAKK